MSNNSDKYINDIKQSLGENNYGKSLEYLIDLFGETNAITCILRYYESQFNFDKLIADLSIYPDDQVCVALLSNFLYMKGSTDHSKELMEKVKTPEGNLTLSIILYLGSLSKETVTNLFQNWIKGLYSHLPSFTLPSFLLSLITMISPIIDRYGFGDGEGENGHGLSKNEKRTRSIELYCEFYMAYPLKSEIIENFIGEHDSDFIHQVKKLAEYKKQIQQLKAENTTLKLKIEHLLCQPSIMCENCGNEVGGGELYHQAKSDFKNML